MSFDLGSVALKFTGDDSQLKQTIAGVKSDVSGLGGAFKGIGSAAGGLALATTAAAGLGAVLKTGYGEAMDAASGIAQLEAGIKSTGGAAGVTTQEMLDLAGEIQNYSGQTDDSIVATEKLLLTFTNIKNEGPNDIFTQTTKAAADMAAKMGGDASASAIQLGKALNDPIKGVSALQRVGVVFTAAQKDAIAAMMDTGDVAGAQSIILKELQVEFGGAAEAAGDSLPGQMQIAKRSFEDISQSLLETFLPLIQKVISAVQSVLNWFKDLPGPIQKVIIIGGGLLAVVAGLGMAIGPLITGIKAVSGVFSMLGAAGGPVGLVVLAIAAIIAVVVLVIKYHEEIWNALTTAWNAIKDFFIGIWDAISAAFHKVWDAIKDFFIGLWEWLKGFFAEWGPVILTVVAPFIGIPLLIYQHWDEIKQWFADLWESIKGALIAAWDAIKGAFEAVWNAIKGAFDAAWGALKDAFWAMIDWLKGIPGWILDKFKDAGTWLLDTGKKIFTGLWDGIKWVWDFLITGWMNIGEKIKGFFVDAGKWLFEIGKKIMSGLWDGLKEMWNKVKDWFTGIGSKIKGFFSGIFGGGSGGGQTMKNTNTGGLAEYAHGSGLTPGGRSQASLAIIHGEERIFSAMQNDNLIDALRATSANAYSAAESSRSSDDRICVLLEQLIQTVRERNQSTVMVQGSSGLSQRALLANVRV
jgi:phage-related protein